MSKNKRNAIILTSIQGETGVTGVNGAPGFSVQHGVGDPNNITDLEYPDYSNEPGAGSSRGSEEIIFQDTDTGDIWSYQYLNGVPTTGVWVLVDNIRGLPGPPGDPSASKIDISFGGRRVTNPYIFNGGTYNLNRRGLPPFVVADFLFPGTNVAPDLATATAMLACQESGNTFDYIIRNADTNDVYARATGYQARQMRILSFTPVVGAVWPTEPTHMEIACNLVDLAYKDRRGFWKNWRRGPYLYAFSMYKL
jgi:hypothetical protein